MSTIQGHTISHAPSMTLIHSSHGRKTVSVSNSVKITKIPEVTAICVAVESRSNRRAHGEMHNQRPSSQLHQSSHCFGSENPTAIVVPVKSGISKNLWGKINQTPTYGRHCYVRSCRNGAITLGPRQDARRAALDEQCFYPAGIVPCRTRRT